MAIHTGPEQLDSALYTPDHSVEGLNGKKLHPDILSHIEPEFLDLFVKMPDKLGPLAEDIRQLVEAATLHPGWAEPTESFAELKCSPEHMAQSTLAQYLKNIAWAFTDGESELASKLVLKARNRMYAHQPASTQLTHIM